MRGTCYKKTEKRERGPRKLSSGLGVCQGNGDQRARSGMSMYNFLLIPFEGTVFSIHQGVAWGNSSLVFSKTLVHSDA